VKGGRSCFQKATMTVNLKKVQNLHGKWLTDSKQFDERQLTVFGRFMNH
jgi:hypothetical protein